MQAHQTPTSRLVVGSVFLIVFFLALPFFAALALLLPYFP